MQKIKLFSSKKIRLLLLALCLIWCGLIFYMSAEPADVSSARSGGLTHDLLNQIIPDFETLGGARQTKIEDVAEHLIRKTAHFLSYTALGIFTCLFSLSFLSKKRTHFLRSLALCVLYAASDEWHQSFVPGRGPSVSDVLLDSTGAVCGIFFVLFAADFWLKRNKTR